ncbi:MAG: ABC transporter permease [Gammaproteobacteria bacterium]|nr:ABC transporter permease [Gammaproteobacteria bacterium]
MEESRWAHLSVPLVAVVLTLAAGSVLFAALGKPPLAAFHAFFIEPLTSLYGIGEVLLKTVPLLLIAQGLAIGFRARVWNIGAEGQLLMGAIASGYLAIVFVDSESIGLLPAMILVGTAAGAAWAAVAAWLRVRFNANEILVTFMMSSIALQLLYYLVTGPLKDPMGFNFPQSVMFGDAALFSPLLEDTRVTTSLWLTVVVSLAAWIFMQRSLPGYKLVVSGLAPRAARYAGFAEKQAIWIGLLAGGAMAGLAGVAEIAGPLGSLQRNISPGYGFAAIIVAFLGALHPLGIVFAALFMALIYVGGDMSLISVELPHASITVFQGMLLIFYLASYMFVHYRIRWVRPDQVAGRG